MYGTKLEKHHITAFKEVLLSECEDYDDAQAQKGITFESFKAFQRILIRKLKMDICWTMLRHFGYDNHLLIKKSIWDDKTIDSETLIKARSLELTDKCAFFLVKLYKGQ